MTRTEKQVSHVVGLLWQLGPCVYMSVAGYAPTWARWTFGSWFILWALVMLGKATK